MAITWSPTQILSGEAMTGLSNGNLTVNGSAKTFLATVGKQSGKWYWELDTTAGTESYNYGMGVAAIQHNQNNPNVSGEYSVGWQSQSYGIISNNFIRISGVTIGVSPVGCIVGIALDATLKRLWFSRNNVWIMSGDPEDNLNPSVDAIVHSWFQGTLFFPSCTPFTGSMTAHFAEADLTYTPPTGFSALTEPSDWQGLVGRALTTPLRSDMEDGGPLSIIEPVTRLNTIPPQSRRVRLCDQRSGRLVREQWSDPITGEVDFQYLREGPWVLYALDHTGEHEAVAISDRLATADGLRP